MKLHLFCFTLLLSFFSFSSSAQIIPDSTQKDLKDVLFPNRKASGREEALKIQKGLLPYISYSPATGLEFGLAGTLAGYLGDARTTRMSNLSLSTAYTTKGQLYTSFRNVVFSNNDDWVFLGDIRFYNFSQSTYGLGTSSPENSEIPLEFNMIRFNENALRRIYKAFYAGGGIFYQRHYLVKGYTPVTFDQGIPTEVPATYDAYSLYCFQHGFNPKAYTSAGLNLTTAIDNRDNVINAYKGVYARLTYTLYGKVLGGASNWQNLYSEFKTYLPISSNRQQRLAFWYLGSYVTSGSAPYMDLQANGWDTFNNSGRGYVQGRFRGNSFAYAETEYRMDILKNGLLGAVAFLNCTTASNKDTGEQLFDAMKPAGGLGLRIKLNKISRTNITIDYGIGKNSNGFYFNVGEVF